MLPRASRPSKSCGFVDVLDAMDALDVVTDRLARGRRHRTAERGRWISSRPLLGVGWLVVMPVGLGARAGLSATGCSVATVRSWSRTELLRRRSRSQAKPLPA